MGVSDQASCTAQFDGRVFLFVGGPFGPFFRELANALAARGAAVCKAHVNGADIWDWGWSDAVRYAGRAPVWPNWIRALMHRKGVTDLVTFGDVQFYARTAIAMAREADVRIHVFEEGYFRPHWITLEDGGVNENTMLPRNPSFYRVAAEPIREHPHDHIGAIMPGAVRAAAAAHFGQYAFKPMFPGYAYPYQYPSWAQALGHAARYVQRKRQEKALRAAMRALIEQPEPYYLALLQKPGDSQITTHSAFPTVGAFIEHVLKSFHAHAPAHSLLAFKAHPLDHGLERYDLILAKLAADMGIQDRVVLLDGGHLATLVRGSAGIVTLNSTAGLTALHFGRPTKALGRTFYNMDGLTDRQPLHTFWTNPAPPDMDLYLRFRAVVMRETQLNGGYTTPYARALAIRAALVKLYERQPISRHRLSPPSGTVALKTRELSAA